MAPYLIACDGAHSTVRHALDLRFAGESYAETFVLADVAARGDTHPDFLKVHFTDEDVLAIIPMGDDRVRIVASVQPEADGLSEDDEPTLTEIRDLVRARGAADLKIADPSWMSRFHISRRVLGQFRHGNIFFAGDAAHVHSPAGGQGMNTGMQDAFNLGWKLDFVHRHLAPDAFLDSYDTERKLVADAVLKATDRITQVATLQSSATQELRNLLLPVLGGVHHLEESFAEGLAELRVNYRNSPIVGQDGGRHVLAGDRAPDGQLRRYHEPVRKRIYELLRKGRHLLLAFTGYDETQRAQLDDVRDRLREWLPDDATFVPIAPDESLEDMAGAWIDDSGRLHAAYAADEGAVVLIRPDGYVGYRSSGLVGDLLQAYLERHFHAAHAHR